jgi:hypothetical protein
MPLVALALRCPACDNLRVQRGNGLMSPHSPSFRRDDLLPHPAGRVTPSAVECQPNDGRRHHGQGSQSCVGKSL